MSTATRTRLPVNGTHERVPFALELSIHETPPPVESLPYWLDSRGYGTRHDSPPAGTLTAYLVTADAPDDDPERGYRDGRRWHPAPVAINGIPYRLRIVMQRQPGEAWHVVRGDERPVAIDRLAWWTGSDGNVGAVATFGGEATDKARSWAWDLARVTLPAYLDRMAADLVPLAIASLEDEAARRETFAEELRDAAVKLDEGARACIAATR